MPLTLEDCQSVLAGVEAAVKLCGELVRVANLQEEEESEFAQFTDSADWVNAGVSLLCMVTAALAAGLTMGIVSLDYLDLRVKERGESAEERGYAKTLLPLIKWTPRHQLLVTLLLLNSVANEALPLFLDKLVPPWCAIIVSVTAVLFVGEILPSAIFTGPSKLKIASGLTRLVWVVMMLLSPLAYPLAWVLDWLIPEHETLTTRNEVRALVDVQREIAAERGVASGEAFHEDEADLVRGALSLSAKLVADVMVPLADVFTLPSSAVLDEPTMRTLLLAGHSRVPVYHGPDPSSCTSFLLLKDQLLCNPADATPVAKLRTHAPIWVGPESSLFGLLNSFQEGQAHMAFVSRHPELAMRAVASRGEWPTGTSRCVGVITLEDIIEEILTEEIYDESDLAAAEQTINDFVKTIVRPRLENKKMRRAATMPAGATSSQFPRVPTPPHEPTMHPAVQPTTHPGIMSSPSASRLIVPPPALGRSHSQRLKVLRGKTLATPDRPRPDLTSSFAAARAPAVDGAAVLTSPLLAAEQQPGA